MTFRLGNAPRVHRHPVRHRGIQRGKMINVGQVAVLGLGVALLSAQQQAPIFHAATRLVEVTVTVVDKKGNPVAGLGPADFVVVDQGKPQPVALFRFDGGRAAAAALCAKVERARLGTLSAWETDDRIVAEAFTEAFPDPGQEAAIGLAASIMRMDAIVDAAIRGKRTERSLAAIQALGTHLAGIPGRKNLVWIGGGFSMASITGGRYFYSSDATRDALKVVSDLQV